MGHQLIGFLGGRIQRERMIDVLIDGKRHVGIRAVDRTGGRIDQVPDAVPAASFDDVQESGHVAVDVDVRIGDGIAYAGLGARWTTYGNFSAANKASMPARSARSSFTNRKLP